MSLADQSSKTLGEHRREPGFQIFFLMKEDDKESLNLILIIVIVIIVIVSNKMFSEKINK